MLLSGQLFDHGLILRLQISFVYSHCPTHEPHHQDHLFVWQFAMDLVMFLLLHPIALAKLTLGTVNENVI